MKGVKVRNPSLMNIIINALSIVGREYRTESALESFWNSIVKSDIFQSASIFSKLATRIKNGRLLFDISRRQQMEMAMEYESASKMLYEGLHSQWNSNARNSFQQAKVIFHKYANIALNGKTFDVDNKEIAMLSKHGMAMCCYYLGENRLAIKYLIEAIDIDWKLSRKILPNQTLINHIKDNVHKISCITIREHYFDQFQGPYDNYEFFYMLCDVYKKIDYINSIHDRYIIYKKNGLDDTSIYLIVEAVFSNKYKNKFADIVSQYYPTRVQHILAKCLIDM